MLCTTYDSRVTLMHNVTLNSSFQWPSKVWSLLMTPDINKFNGLYHDTVLKIVNLKWICDLLSWKWTLMYQDDANSTVKTLKVCFLLCWEYGNMSRFWNGSSFSTGQKVKQSSTRLEQIEVGVQGNQRIRKSQGIARPTLRVSQPFRVHIPKTGIRGENTSNRERMRIKLPIASWWFHQAFCNVLMIGLWRYRWWPVNL